MEDVMESSVGKTKSLERKYVFLSKLFVFYIEMLSSYLFYYFMSKSKFCRFLHQSVALI